MRRHEECVSAAHAGERGEGHACCTLCVTTNASRQAASGQAGGKGGKGGRGGKGGKGGESVPRRRCASCLSAVRAGGTHVVSGDTEDTCTQAGRPARHAPAGTQGGFSVPGCEQIQGRWSISRQAEPHLRGRGGSGPRKPRTPLYKGSDRGSDRGSDKRRRTHLYTHGVVRDMRCVGWLGGKKASDTPGGGGQG